MSIEGLGRATRLMNVDQFLAFYEGRPEGERWELVDGIAAMMRPPNLVHQRIGGNLEALLNATFRASRLDIRAYQNIGVRIPGIRDFSPEPDVAVVPRPANYTSYAERLFLAAEVRSDSNSPEEIRRKVELYMEHPDNLYCLVISQREILVELYARAAGWRRTMLRSVEDMLAFEEFGFRCVVGDLYEDTPLQPGPSEEPA